MKRSVYFVIIVAVSAIVYGFTVCPTVEFIDSGELALACEHLGIMHPTGYPLYTMLGHLASLAFWGSLIFRVNMLSLIITAFASGVLYLLTSEILAKYAGSQFPREVVAGCTASFMAFSPVWWSQGTTNEVYSLNLLLIGIFIWSLLFFFRTQEGKGRWLVLAAYSLGLCLTNNLSAVYLIPGFLYLLIAELRKTRVRLSLTLWSIAALVFPGTLYSFLPIRAQFHPFLNWGGVSNLYFLWKHITGWQYQVWMFAKPLTSLEILSAKMGFSTRLFLEQFRWHGTALIFLGIIVGLFRNRRILACFILVILLNLIYVLNYEIADIDSYYLPMFLIFSILMAMGIMYLTDFILTLSSQIGFVKYALWALIIILPFSNLAANFRESNCHDQTFAKQGVLDLVSSMNTNGVAIVENWDFYSPWLYLHFAEGIRPDLVLLDKELMRRSWYIDFVQRYHGDIYENSRPEFEEFLRQVASYEESRPYNPATIDRAYYSMLNAVINHESARRPVYTNMVSDSKFLAGHVLVPDGILFRFFKSDQFLDRPWFKFDNAYWENRYAFKSWRVGIILSYYVRSFGSRSEYCRNFGRSEEAGYYRNLRDQVESIISADEKKQ